MAEAALAPRHAVLEAAVDASRLQALAPEVAAAFAPCDMTYLDESWNISCFADINDPAMISARLHPPLRDVLSPLLEDVTEVLRRWLAERQPQLADRGLRRLQSFVTRYRPVAGETHLRKHIDGHHVCGSLVLQLHSPAFEGGGISVWDPHKERSFYPLQAGDLCLLERGVWHQSHPISSGERWVLVVFCDYQPLDDHQLLPSGATVKAEEFHPKHVADAGYTQTVATSFRRDLKGLLKQRRSCEGQDSTEALFDLVEKFRRPFQEASCAESSGEKS